MKKWFKMGPSTRAVFLMEVHLVEMSKRGYTWASNAKKLEILRKYYDVIIGTRRLQQIRKWLKDRKLINTVFRWQRYSDGTFKQISTMVALTIRGANQLIRDGVEKGNTIKKRIVAWYKKKDGRWPKEQETLPRPPPPARTKDQEKIEDLASGVFQPF